MNSSFLPSGEVHSDAQSVSAVVQPVPYHLVLSSLLPGLAQRGGHCGACPLGGAEAENQEGQ